MAGEYGTLAAHRPSPGTISRPRVLKALGAAAVALALVALAGSQAALGVRGGAGVDAGLWGRGGAELLGVSMVDDSAIQRANKGAHDRVSFVDLSGGGGRNGGAAAAASAAQAAPEGPVPAGHVLHVHMPASEMSKLAVGSIVKGQVRRPMLSMDGEQEFNTVDFTGKVRSLQLLTLQGKVGSGKLGEPDEGVVTVKMLSDQFIAPGTAVSGMVAGKVFKGTVTKAPSFDERLDEAEKRARELSPPFCDEMCKLNKEIAATAQRIRDFETSRKLRSEASRLEKRTWHLEHPPPPPETVKYVGAWAGFKFDVPQGPNQYGPRIKEMKERLGGLNYQYAKELKPLYKKTRELEHRLDEVEGKKTVQERIGALEDELGHMEECMKLFSRKSCVQRVMKKYKFAGFRGHAAEEEEEKLPFVKAKGKVPLDERAEGKLIPEPEEEEEEDNKGGDDGDEAAMEAGADQFGEGNPIPESVKKGGAEEGGGEGGAEGDNGGGGEKSAKGSTQSLASGAGSKPQPSFKWAPGQRSVWKKYLHQAGEMDGGGHALPSQDNVMSNW